MDRKTWLAVGLCIAAFLGWNWYYNKTYGPYLQQQEELRRQAASAAAKSASVDATPAPAAANPVAAPTPAPEDVPVMKAQDERLSAEGKKVQADFVFNNDTGGIEAVELLMHLNERSEPVSLNSNRVMPIGALEAVAGTALGGFAMTTDRKERVVTFTKRDGDGLEITKVFSLPPNDSVESPYVVYLSLTFQNTAAAPLSRPGYFLSAGAAAPIHERDMPIYTRFDWSKNGKYGGIDTNWFGAGHIPLIGIQTSPEKTSYTESDGAIDWVAVASQYFTTIVTAVDGGSGSSAWATRFPLPDAPPGHYGIQGAMGLEPFTVEPGQAVTKKFVIYSGPKENARLQRLGHNEEAVLNFGIFGFISEILLWGMNALYGLVGTYAAAIIVLTVIIKLLLWPLQNKATNSMRRMAALSPKMTELREKYKDDPQKMNMELMKLYKDYGVNPFSGCLPILIQIPIFFGFYGMLGVAIELRNSSFLWIHDLSQPDTVWHIPGINFPINILPLVMAGTMVWQMAISPKSGDAMQQRILMFMPVIFVVFAYNYASALSLYWTTQNLFSIVQLYMTRNKPLPTLEKMEAAAKKKPSSGSKPRKKRPS